MKRRALGLVSRTLVLASFCSAAPLLAQAAAPDPFYVGLMRDGRSSFARGSAKAAREDFRLACFGFLDHPALLAECRIRLALADAALGDRESFSESFNRLEELETRFRGYSEAAVSAEERQAFEARVVDWIAPEVLRSIPAFAPLLAKKKSAELAKLSPREQKKAAEKKAAETQAAEKRAADKKAAEKKAAEKQAAEKQASTKARTAPPAAGRNDPAEPAGDKTAAGKRASSTTPSTKPAPARAPLSAAAPAPAETPSVPPGPTGAEERSIAEARKQLASASRREELDAVLRQVRPLADRYPASSELQYLVGEIGYRAANWEVGATYLGRPDPAGPADPTLRFYLAVCLYENGDRVAATRVAATGLDKLPRSPFVDSYLRKIQPPAR